ncbi:hypothetical protein MAMT_01706 [Methylacidimicrobium tartarophylax]|uniref:Uncharacterized protein n=1 Tax=Methylacidimicrobium tartarophylax TaxID=1041768 RepID=A0A5E6MD41_9BACT|nr:hypothetical protein MAMT_01706 [Methylacidimicrobium tartarophylax]
MVKKGIRVGALPDQMHGQRGAGGRQRLDMQVVHVADAFLRAQPVGHGVHRLDRGPVARNEACGQRIARIVAPPLPSWKGWISRITTTHGR